MLFGILMIAVFLWAGVVVLGVVGGIIGVVFIVASSIDTKTYFKFLGILCATLIVVETFGIVIANADDQPIFATDIQTSAAIDSQYMKTPKQVEQEKRDAAYDERKKSNELAQKQEEVDEGKEAVDQAYVYLVLSNNLCKKFLSGEERREDALEFVSIYAESIKNNFKSKADAELAKYKTKSDYSEILNEMAHVLKDWGSLKSPKSDLETLIQRSEEAQKILLSYDK